MHYEIPQNPKHESYMRMAFLEQIHGHGCTVTLVVREADMVDPERGAVLDNFNVPRAHLKYITRVVFEGSSDARDILYERS